ncbi:hypothetical protein KFK09_028563 [Dendrobium nobile]|uniref:Reverse transcriptase zinc-binding domain-containing protein n=1 Tax=Dendrobium nobile TaxID=94219 RepID=A0A8T3A289_DENNO|nr:hypothetical protein KFK09_028563 [Dendrobium nobile]
MLQKFQAFHLIIPILKLLSLGGKWGNSFNFGQSIRSISIKQGNKHPSTAATPASNQSSNATVNVSDFFVAPSADQLISRNIPTHGLFCNCNSETASHLFFECDLSFSILKALFPGAAIFLLRPNII